MISYYTPVLIPTLNRFFHFKNCIESLLECEGSQYTDLFIVLDFPSKEAHWEGYNKINAFLHDLIGFKSISVIKREINFGAHANILDGYDVIFKNYDSLILSEDDNVFAKDFLIYMNKSLQKYKYDANVFSISGYNYPIQIPKSYQNNVYFWSGFSAWGVGLWRDKFLKIDWSEDVVQFNTKCFLKDYKKAIQLDKIGNHYIPALLHMYNVKQVHGDTYISMYQFINNITSVFPVISRVRNMGHDGSGINCGLMENDVFSTQEIYTGSSNYEISKVLENNPIIDKILYNHFKVKLNSKLKLFVKLFLFNVGFNQSKK